MIAQSLLEAFLYYVFGGKPDPTIHARRADLYNLGLFMIICQALGTEVCLSSVSELN